VLRQRRRLPAGVEAALGALSRVDRVPVSRTAPSLAG
jgi:hypothetical protein